VSAASLEHVLVLLHFGSAQAETAIAALPAHERALIAQIDRRAFHADGERAARAVTVAVEELPVSTSICGVPRLFRFFLSPSFVAVVRGEMGLVPAMAADLEAGAGDMAGIEGLIARARRRRRPRMAGVALADGVAIATGATGALEHFAVERLRLGDRPEQAVAAGRRCQPFSAGGQAQPVAAFGQQLQPLPDALAMVLADCLTPRPRTEVEALFIAAGAEAADAADLVDELLADGLLSTIEVRQAMRATTPV
jgi:hypothetical protein